MLQYKMFRKGDRVDRSDPKQILYLYKKYVSPLTLFKGSWQDRLDEAIFYSPDEFVELLTSRLVNNRQQLALLKYFLSLVVVDKRIDEQFRAHLNLIYNSRLDLWPSSFSHFVSVVASHGYQFYTS